MSIKLEAGQWYRTRGGEIVYWVGTKPGCTPARYHGIACRQNGDSLSYLLDGQYSDEIRDHQLSIIEHLPDCTGFDWVPPPKLQLREGAWYERRDGVIVGPCKPNTDYDRDERPWVVGDYVYANDGTNNAKTHCHLIREVDPPKPQYRAFKNAEEFKPHWSRLLRYLKNERNHYFSVDAFNDECLFLSGDSDDITYQWLVDNCVFDDCGLPAGVLDGV